MARPLVADGGTASNIERTYGISSRREPIRHGLSPCGLSDVLTTPLLKKYNVTNHSERFRTRYNLISQDRDRRRVLLKSVMNTRNT